MIDYKRTARLRQAQREQEMAERRERAWQVAWQAARLLKESNYDGPVRDASSTHPAGN